MEFNSFANAASSTPMPSRDRIYSSSSDESEIMDHTAYQSSPAPTPASVPAPTPASVPASASVPVTPEYLNRFPHCRYIFIVVSSINVSLTNWSKVNKTDFYFTAEQIVLSKLVRMMEIDGVRTVISLLFLGEPQTVANITRLVSSRDYKFGTVIVFGELPQMNVLIGKLDVRTILGNDSTVISSDARYTICGQVLNIFNASKSRGTTVHAPSAQLPVAPPVDASIPAVPYVHRQRPAVHAPPAQLPVAPPVDATLRATVTAVPYVHRQRPAVPYVHPAIPVAPPVDAAIPAVPYVHRQRRPAVPHVHPGIPAMPPVHPTLPAMPPVHPTLPMMPPIHPYYATFFQYPGHPHYPVYPPPFGFPQYPPHNATQP